MIRRAAPFMLGFGLAGMVTNWPHFVRWLCAIMAAAAIMELRNGR